MGRKNIFGLIVIVLAFACNRNPLDVDISKVNVPKVKVDRMDQEVFKTGTMSEVELQANLQRKYGNFYNGFQSVISSVFPDSTAQYNLYMFRHDSIMRAAFLEGDKLYPDLNELESALTLAYKHFRFHFPLRHLPRPVAYISGFNFKQFPVDSIIGIGLDMYLGSNVRFYQMIQFPKYKTYAMNSNYMLTDFVAAWMLTEFPKSQEKKDLLNEMIYNGKILYLADALMPSVEDSVKIEYASKQLNWCKANEYNMWAYLVQQKLLYTTDPTEIIKYIGDGPFTAAFNPKDSPARVGSWLGWMIVRNFMKHNPKLSLEDLMAETDGQVILSKSHYKPSKQ